MKKKELKDWEYQVQSNKDEARNTEHLFNDFVKEVEDLEEQIEEKDEEIEKLEQRIADLEEENETLKNPNT
jgi:phage shock protein A